MIHFRDLSLSGNNPVISINFKEIVNCFSFEPSGRTFAVGGESGVIRLYDMRYIGDSSTAGFLKEFKGHHNVVKALQYDGVFVVSGSYDQHIHARNIKTDKTMFTFQAGRGT